MLIFCKESLMYLKEPLFEIDTGNSLLLDTSMIYIL